MVKPYEALYTVKEAAGVLKTNPECVYTLIETGKLRALRLGRIKIRGSDLERYIESIPAICSGNVSGDKLSDTA